MVQEKWTARGVRDLKGREKIVCLTAHDCPTARAIDAAGLHLILVGDSLAMTALGYETTLPVTMEQMLHHTAAVARGVRHALVVADMPFLSYQVSVEEGVRNAGRFIKEAGADAVKVEGGAVREGLVGTLVRNGIPVLGHIGLTPQSVRELGGFKVQGKSEAEAEALVTDARALERAGAFAVVVECVPADLGAKITGSIGVPTVGIGAGPGCDGQILVTHDLLGLPGAMESRFVKRYAELGAAMRHAFESYKEEVQRGVFPDRKHAY